MGERLLSPKDLELIDQVKVLDIRSWPKVVKITFGEEEITIRQ